MEKLKILHIHEVYSPYKGGSAIRIENLLVNQFDQFRDQIDVICSTKGLENESFNEVICNIRVLRISNFRKKLFWNVIKLHFKNKYDFIHIHNTWVCFLVFPLYFLSRGKIVLEIHSLKKRSFWKQKFHELFILISPKIIVLSNLTKEYLIRKLRINPKRIFVVTNGLKLTYQFKKQEITPKLLTENSLNKLIYFGSLYKWQGTDNILELCKYINRNDLNIKITIIGEGPEKTSFLNSRYFNKFLKVLDFMPTNKLHEEALKHDAFLYLRPPNLQNELTFPLKILELGSLNLPIICTNRKAHFEVFRKNSEDEYLSIIRNDNKIPEQIISLLKDNEALKRRALTFKDYVSHNDFSWKNSAVTYRKSYV